MWKSTLKEYKIVLGSGSPRRQEFLSQLHLDFEVRTFPVEEVYPSDLKGHEIADYLAKLKANALLPTLKDREIIITSDTVVWHRNTALGKPKNTENAIAMLKILSGDWHEVITSVCFTTTKKQILVNETTKVKFKELSEEEILFYCNLQPPLDKAGGYGIQDWIGLIGIEKIEGSYSNVVGLPTHLVYKTLMRMVA
ncbi:Maf-like protein [Arenibacter sp. GZD96]|uniref:Maf-like protein n=1 Tax=Aurantibrevibacter litoralis TaxID=3106030 RepID=UPI002AFF8143|nr:Maf-like protein [Arenibacter sp. GZD-96]MEA1786200.1 Maf-like protein [Arenibacter sp. GZD-96]